ncbi:hypothetical protein MRX96_027551 [Rhipicephalus microplus]
MAEGARNLPDLLAIRVKIAAVDFCAGDSARSLGGLDKKICRDALKALLCRSKRQKLATVCRGTESEHLARGGVPSDEESKWRYKVGVSASMWVRRLEMSLKHDDDIIALAVSLLYFVSTFS